MIYQGHFQQVYLFTYLHRIRVTRNYVPMFLNVFWFAFS
jgi:hypothetical protein